LPIIVTGSAVPLQNRRTFLFPTNNTVPAAMMASIESLLIPLALTTGLGTASPSLHRDVRAFVTGYNTVVGQTDSTPCVAASGAEICGRRDAVACPRRIGFGTIVEIRGTTYVCEDRLAKKFDSRFDISCDKDLACPYQVAGWATIKVYDTDRPEQAVAPKVISAWYRPRWAEPTRVRNERPHPVIARARYLYRMAARFVASSAAIVTVLRGRG
jgi:hypothetical protein